MKKKNSLLILDILTTSLFQLAAPPRVSHTLVYRRIHSTTFLLAIVYNTGILDPELHFQFLPQFHCSYWISNDLQLIFVYYTLSITHTPRFIQLRQRSVANELLENPPSSNVIMTSTQSCGG
jgi:hypothetical protein